MMGLCLTTSGLQLQASDDFFALPSPSEILADAESEGLSSKLNRESLGVLRVDLDRLAKEDPARACFDMGRIFAVSGYGFKDLNNKVILQLAQKVLGGAQKLDLPQVISDEIDQFYRLMVSKNNWDRNELLLSFTTARASLMYLLKDSGKVSEKDQTRLSNYGVALECGMWYQSLVLATHSLEDEQLEAFQSVYMDPDYLTYFEKILKKPTHRGHEDLFLKLKKVNDLCLQAVSDDAIVPNEKESLRAALMEVMK
jgi:hypothetical protein